MTAPLPPCGPERDALVAEALGCTTWVRIDGERPAFNEECRDWKEWHSVAPTLGDAASSAIIAASKEGA